MELKLNIIPENVKYAQLELLITILALQKSLSTVIIEKLSLTEDKEIDALRELNEQVEIFSKQLVQSLCERYGNDLV